MEKETKKQSKKILKKVSSKITLMKLLKAGAHFGHSKSKCHPNMKPFIHSLRNNVHIIDLEQTLEKLNQALEFVKEIIKKDGQIIFISTKSQAKEIIKKAAIKANMLYVVERWLGGTFTNFETINKQIQYLKELEEKQKSRELKKYTKKEQLIFKQKIEKMNRVFSGLKNLKGLPSAVFILDIEHDKIAFQEVLKSKIPIIALVDTNADPKKIDYPIPCNDDAIKVIKLIAKVFTQTIIKKSKALIIK